jgi:hypothetical protein
LCEIRVAHCALLGGLGHLQAEDLLAVLQTQTATPKPSLVALLQRKCLRHNLHTKARSMSVRSGELISSCEEGWKGVN